MIKMSEYAKRRKQVMKAIGPNAILILSSPPVTIRNGDYDYPHRQSSDLYYLSGYEEPESVLVLAPKRKEGEFILFNRKKDRTMEIWEGVRTGQEGAVKQYGADQAFPIADIAKVLPTLLENREQIYYSLGKDKPFDKIVLQAVNQVRNRIRSGVRAPLAFVDIVDILHEMRLIKSPAEIAVMRKSAEISAKAHARAIQYCKPGVYEYELEAEILHDFNRNGARFPAYTSIVGAGENACILHYNSNNCRVKSGDLVLIDAGAEYQYYAADITRTFPANGRFTEEQKAIYELVLKAQLAGIQAVKPGAAFNAPQKAIVKIITQGLLDLGLLKGRLQDLIDKEAYFPFYMHRSGHWLGLDVHDAGRYKAKDQWRTFKPGMVLTVEPGIYISADIPGVPKRFKNIGVRIEDDILVTKGGTEVLSHHCPKTVKEIEAMMSQSSK